MHIYLSAAGGGGLRCLLTLAYRPARGSSVDGSLLWDTGVGVSAGRGCGSRSVAGKVTRAP